MSGTEVDDLRGSPSTAGGVDGGCPAVRVGPRAAGRFSERRYSAVVRHFPRTSAAGGRYHLDSARTARLRASFHTVLLRYVSLS